MLVLPVKFSFYGDIENTVWDGIDQAIDCFFGLDILLMFLTPIIVDGKLVTSLGQIAKAYLKFWFWVDVLSVLPFELMFNRGHMVSLVRLSRLPKLYRLVKITKMIRSVKAGRSQNNLWTQLYNLMQLSPSSLR